LSGQGIVGLVVVYSFLYRLTLLVSRYPWYLL
jgi:hypothetical protein